MKAIFIIVSLIALTLVLTTVEKLRIARAEAGNYRLDDQDKVNQALRKYRELID